ncbi:hypothetical protein [Clostridium cochlearium]|uniref:hypothetical protein n=1 Tax=Clostridium cochlearium TaxID=1494 RepID=UPI001C0F0C2A|nr:hypothetical protein [Clostridium cochlearium]MBU5268872.1 hypothetical protein [Clostridium cochlearium]
MSNTIDEVKNLLNIENVDSSINFWMIRTKKGCFYDEFIQNEFIALGWNTITHKELSDIIKQTDKKKKNELKDKLKRKIEKKYPKNKQPSHIINKCIRFVEVMKNGDIIMIPSRNNKKISFAIVKDYFEDNKCTYEKEIEVISRIDSKVDYNIESKCPYKKRRKITLIKEIDGEKLNPNLYKVLASYHSISKINKYADYILSSIYNLYIWKNKLNLVFNVEQNKGINAKELSSFIYNASSLITTEDEDLQVFTKINLNSPGDIILTITQKISDIAVVLKNNLFWIFLLWGAVSGVKIGPIQLNSIPETIIKIRESNSKLKNDKKNREFKSLEIEEKKRLLEKYEKCGVADSLEKIKSASQNLNINQDVASNVIKVNFNHKKYDE